MSSPQLRVGRVSEQGAYYVLTTVTHRRAAILHGDAARCVVQEILERENEGLVANISWVVMPNHVHWLFELCCDALVTPVRRLKSLSARRLHSVCGSDSAVWQPGYYDHRVRAGEDLRAQAFYIQQNPVRSGLIALGEKFEHQWCRYDD